MRILNLGAGVQSTTVLLKSLRGEFPHIDHAIFADTGYEPQSTYDCVERLQKEAEKFGVPVHVVRRDPAKIRQEFRDQIPAFTLSPDGNKGILRRQCTRDYKIEPIRQKIREILGVGFRKKVPKGTMVTQVFGIGWDETHRMKTPDVPWTEHEYPLIDIKWGRTECLAWLKDNWPYQVARSACWNCPYRSPKEWKNLHDYDYPSWLRAVKFDDELRTRPPRGITGVAFLHRSLVPLAELNLWEEQKHKQADLFGSECEGMCGV